MTTRRIVTPLAFAFLAGACSAQAQAQSSQVQFYGLVGAYAGTSKLSGAPEATTVVNGGGLTTSFFGFKGEEDLGGGTSAFFMLESFFQPDSGAYGRTSADPLWSRNAIVGLKGKYGKISIGRHMTPTYYNMQAVNPFVGSVQFSPLVLQSFIPSFNNAIIGDSIWNNTVQYTTPSYGGLVGTVDYGPGEVTGRSGIANLGLHLRYDAGPLVAVASDQRVRQLSTGTVPVLTEQKAWLAGFAYDLRVVKLFAAGVGTDTYGVPTSTRTWSGGATVPLSGGYSIIAAYAHTGRDTPGLVSTSRQTGTLCLDYALSKRTDLFVLGMVDKRSDAGAGTSTAVGMRQAF
jgi:predicted porin